MKALPAHDQAALSAIANAIADPKALLAAWQSDDLFQEVGNDGLRLRVGEQAAQTVLVVAERYERAVHRPLPPLLAALLSTINGMNIEETADGGAAITREPSVRNVWNGWLAAEDIESDELGDGAFSGLRFATAYAQCPILLVDDGERSGAVVFDDGEGSPIVVATDLASFLLEVARTGMSMEAVVGKRMG